MNSSDQVIEEIIDILESEYGLKTCLKGSYGYGTPYSGSDIDIEITGRVDPSHLSKRFRGTHSSIVFKDSSGDEYESTLIEFSYKSYSFSLVYNDNLKVFSMVKEITQSIKVLPLNDRYVLRLAGGGLKYDSIKAYKRILLLFEQYRADFDPQVINDVLAGKVVDATQAKNIRNKVQLEYRKKYLS